MCLVCFGDEDVPLYTMFIMHLRACMVELHSLYLSAIRITIAIIYMVAIVMYSCVNSSIVQHINYRKGTTGAVQL